MLYLQICACVPLQTGSYSPEPEETGGWPDPWEPGLLSLPNFGLPPQQGELSPLHGYG